MQMKSKLTLLAIVFVGLNIAAMILLSAWDSGEDLKPPTAEERKQLRQEKAVTILGESWQRIKNRKDAIEPTTIDRQNAAEFALEQTASMIKYLFAAAAAFLGFLAKLLLDPAQSKAKQEKTELPSSSRLLLVAAALSFLSSLFGGLQAQGWFTSLATATQFSLVREFTAWVLYQEILVLLGVILLVSSAVPLIAKKQT